ncbi:MAG TPA: hypothetical protein VIY52_19070 [Streptosporangiaceae bacterium]
MATYATMTPGGIYGSTFEAESWEEVDAKAVAAGYEVLDWTDHGGENILVISADPEPEYGPPAHDCPYEAFLEDPITQAYGASGMISLVSCSVCDEYQARMDS